MAHYGPTSSFEKTPAYPRANAVELIHSSSDEIREALLSHIATINPKLAQEIMTSPTEEHAMLIIGRVETIARAKFINDKSFPEIAANNSSYALAA